MKWMYGVMRIICCVFLLLVIVCVIDKKIIASENDKKIEKAISISKTILKKFDVNESFSKQDIKYIAIDKHRSDNFTGFYVVFGDVYHVILDDKYNLISFQSEKKEERSLKQRRQYTKKIIKNFYTPESHVSYIYNDEKSIIAIIDYGTGEIEIDKYYTIYYNFSSIQVSLKKANELALQLAAKKIGGGFIYRLYPGIGLFSNIKPLRGLNIYFSYKIHPDANSGDKGFSLRKIFSKPEKISLYWQVNIIKDPEEVNWKVMRVQIDTKRARIVGYDILEGGI